MDRSSKTLVLFAAMIGGPWLPSIYVRHVGIPDGGLQHAMPLLAITAVTIITSITAFVLMKRMLGPLPTVRRWWFLNMIAFVLFLAGFCLMYVDRSHTGSFVDLPYIMITIAAAHLCYAVGALVLGSGEAAQRL